MVKIDPQYLVGSDADRRYKAEQQDTMQGVFNTNKKIRKYIRLKKSNIKENYITITQTSALGIKKSDMQQRIDEGKLQSIVYNGKTYYSRQDIANCL